MTGQEERKQINALFVLSINNSYLSGIISPIYTTKIIESLCVYVYMYVFPAMRFVMF